MCAMPANESTSSSLHFPKNYDEARGLLTKYGFMQGKNPLSDNTKAAIVECIRDCWDNASIKKLLEDNGFLLSMTNGFDGAINKIKQEVYWNRLDSDIRAELGLWEIKAIGTVDQFKGFFSGGVSNFFSKIGKVVKGVAEATAYKSTTIATIDQFNNAYRLGGDMEHYLELLQFSPMEKRGDLAKTLTQKMYYSKIDDDIKAIFKKYIGDGIKVMDISNSGIVAGGVNTLYATINLSGSTTVNILMDINAQYQASNFGKVKEDLMQLMGVDVGKASMMVDEMIRIKLGKSLSAKPSEIVSMPSPDSNNQPPSSPSPASTSFSATTSFAGLEQPTPKIAITIASELSSSPDDISPLSSSDNISPPPPAPPPPSSAVFSLKLYEKKVGVSPDAVNTVDNSGNKDKRGDLLKSLREKGGGDSKKREESIRELEENMKIKTDQPRANVFPTNKSGGQTPKARNRGELSIGMAKDRVGKAQSNVDKKQLEIKKKTDRIRFLNNEIEKIGGEINNTNGFKERQLLVNKKSEKEVEINRENSELKKLEKALEDYTNESLKAEESLRKLRITYPEVAKELTSEVSSPMSSPSLISDIASPKEPSSPSEGVSLNISDEEVVDKDKEFKR